MHEVCRLYCSATGACFLFPLPISAVSRTFDAFLDTKRAISQGGAVRVPAGLAGMVKIVAFLKELQDEWRPRNRVEQAAGRTSEFGTASERNLAGFLEPFGLQNLSDTVWKLARNGGFLNAETLHFVDDAALYRLSIADSERALILLAAWLHLQQLHEYGPNLVSSGFVSLTKLKSCTDEAMKRSGIRLMGHRRVLLRQIREELANREDLSEAPKASLFTSGADSGVRRARNPTPTRSTSVRCGRGAC
jgi:hypothetical protein